MTRALLCSFAIAPLLAACGGSSPPPAPAPPAATAEASAAATAAPVDEDAKASTKLPTECADKGKLCLPPAAFVKRLCSTKVYTARRKECKGATMGDVTKKCEELDDKLSAVVVEYVRRGGAVPTPPTLP